MNLGDISLSFWNGVKASYSNSGGLSALAGAALGVASRAQARMPPQIILETTCSAPRGINASLTTLLATPMNGLAAMGVFTFQALRDLVFLNSITQPAVRQKGQTYREHQTSRRTEGIKNCLAASLYSVAAYHTNLFSTQILWGMCISNMTSGLTNLGKVGIARTVSVLSAATFTLLNLGFFANTTEECQDIWATWANIFLWGPLVAGTCATLNGVLSPRIAEMVNDNIEKHAPHTDTLGERLEKHFAEGGELDIGGPDAQGNTTWRLIDKEGQEVRVFGNLCPNIQLPGWWTDGSTIQVAENLGEPRYTFELRLPQAGSSDQPPPDPKLLNTFYEEIRSALAEEVTASNLTEFELFLQQSRTIKASYFIVQRNEQQLPTLSYYSGLGYFLPLEDIPQVALVLHPVIDGHVALEIRYNDIQGKYTYTLRNILHAREESIPNCRPGFNDGLIQISKAPIIKGELLFGTAKFPALGWLLRQATRDLSYPLCLSTLPNDSGLFSLGQYDAQSSAADGVAQFEAIPDEQCPTGTFSLNKGYQDYNVLIFKGAYDNYFCRLIDRKSQEAIDESWLPLDTVLEYTNPQDKRPST